VVAADVQTKLLGGRKRCKSHTKMKSSKSRAADLEPDTTDSYNIDDHHHHSKSKKPRVATGQALRQTGYSVSFFFSKILTHKIESYLPQEVDIPMRDPKTDDNTPKSHKRHIANPELNTGLNTMIDVDESDGQPRKSKKPRGQALRRTGYSVFYFSLAKYLQGRQKLTYLM
jgi:hypothetical protein